jgi:DNA-binding MarR family transcriptional regulator
MGDAAVCSVRFMRMASKRKADVNELAQTIERNLRDIRAIMQRPLEDEYSRGQLTGPQRSVMQAVFHSNGMSLKELSRHVGLSHSTVSGIVDRLQARGMLERKAGEDDQRFTMIAITAAVHEFMTHQAPRLAASPLVSALRRATKEEQLLIVRGVETLQEILDASRAAPKNAGG